MDRATNQMEMFFEAPDPGVQVAADPSPVGDLAEGHDTALALSDLKRRHPGLAAAAFNDGAMRLSVDDWCQRVMVDALADKVTIAKAITADPERRDRVLGAILVVASRKAEAYADALAAQPQDAFGWRASDPQLAAATDILLAARMSLGDIPAIPERSQVAAIKRPVARPKM